MIRETQAWSQKEPKGPLAATTIPVSLGAGDALVEVAACGVCHTDVGFWHGDVATRGPRPVVLGHEISGTVVEADTANAGLVGRQVIVPAVWPCGTCDMCLGGAANSCQQQKMPGNDVPGGFAKHVVAPARWLAALPENVGKERLQEMAVIADAVATPYQAAVRSGLNERHLALVVGVGGLGSFLVQIAAAKGAKVVALDVDEGRLAMAREHGAKATLSVKGLSERDVRDKVRKLAKELGAPSWGWKIFETSGTAAGQRTAWELLGHSATLMVVGFTRDKLELRLSNLMAFDAAAMGVWGCRPGLYPEALELVLKGAVKLGPFVERRPMSQVNEVLADAHAGKLARRVILLP